MEIADIEELVKKAVRLCGTQKRLAMEMGVRPGTISLWLKGGIKIQLANIQCLRLLIQRLEAREGQN